jgi:hypothetical protein
VLCIAVVAGYGTWDRRIVNDRGVISMISYFYEMCGPPQLDRTSLARASYVLCVCVFIFRGTRIDRKVSARDV